MKLPFIVSALLSVAALDGIARADGWAVNKDAEQLLPTPQSNFEVVLAGDQTAEMSGGLSDVTNPFDHPDRAQSFDGTNTTVTWSGSNSIGPAPGVKQHFGVFGFSQNPPAVLAEYWTPEDDNVVGRVPGCSSFVTYPAGVGLASVVFTNNTPDEITILTAGFRIENRNTVNIGQMNQSGMPPGSFNPIGITNLMLPPGGFTPSLPLTTIDTNVNSVVIFMDIVFSGTSSGNFYSSDVREWVGSNMNENLSMTPFCFPGHDDVIGCPCNNPPGTGSSGCDNMQPTGTGGAMLTGSGVPSLSNDSLMLNVTNTLNHIHVLFEGTQHSANMRTGAGVRCVSNGLNNRGQNFFKRIKKGNAVGGMISFGGVSAASASKGAPLLPGETYFYYAAYRNAEMNGAPGCPGLTFGFNATNAGAVSWGP